MRTTLTLWLTVERNNKHVRGKKAAIEAIERLLSTHYAMKCLRDTEYEVSVEHDAGGLDAAVEEMLVEINRLADDRHCFLPDCDVQDKASGRSW